MYNKSSCFKRKSDVFKDTHVEDGSLQKSHELSLFGVKNFGSTNLLEHHNRFNIAGKLGFDVGNSSSGGENMLPQELVSIIEKQNLLN